MPNSKWGGAEEPANVELQGVCGLVSVRAFGSYILVRAFGSYILTETEKILSTVKHFPPLILYIILYF